ETLPPWPSHASRESHESALDSILRSSKSIRSGNQWDGWDIGTTLEPVTLTGANRRSSSSHPHRAIRACPQRVTRHWAGRLMRTYQRVAKSDVPRTLVSAKLRAQNRIIFLVLPRPPGANARQQREPPGSDKQG